MQDKTTTKTGKYATIDLGNGIKAKIDAKYRKLCSQFSWAYCATGKQSYVMTNRFLKNQAPQAYLHRLIYEAEYGPIPDGFCIDHINENPLDNTVTNLQAVTIGQNFALSFKRRKAPGEYLGVYEKRGVRKTSWLCKVRGIQKRFATPEAAAEFYDRMTVDHDPIVQWMTNGVALNFPHRLTEYIHAIAA